MDPEKQVEQIVAEMRKGGARYDVRVQTSVRVDQFQEGFEVPPHVTLTLYDPEDEFETILSSIFMETSQVQKLIDRLVEARNELGEEKHC